MASPFMSGLPPATPWASLGDIRAIEPRAMGESRWGGGCPGWVCALRPFLLSCCRRWDTADGSLCLTAGDTPSQGSAQGPQQPEEPRPLGPRPRASLPGLRLQTKTGPFIQVLPRGTELRSVVGGVREGLRGLVWQVEAQMWPQKQAPLSTRGTGAPSTFSQAGPVWRRALPARLHPMPPSWAVPAIMWTVVQQRASCHMGLHPGSGFASKHGRAGCPVLAKSRDG